MEKDFDGWNITKKKVDLGDTSSIFFYEREIWWAYVGVNVGYEQDGKERVFMRPVLILKKFSRRLSWALPLSTKLLKGSFFHYIVAESGTARVAVLPQLKMIDSKRLINKFDIISLEEFESIKKKIVAFLQQPSQFPE